MGMLQSAIRNSIGEGARPGNVVNVYFFGEKSLMFIYPLRVLSAFMRRGWNEHAGR